MSNLFATARPLVSSKPIAGAAAVCARAVLLAAVQALALIAGTVVVVMALAGTLWLTS